MKRLPHGFIRFGIVGWSGMTPFARAGRIVACLSLILLASGFSQESRSAFESSGSMEDRGGLDIDTIQEFDRLDRNANGSLDRTEFLFSEISSRVMRGNERDKADHVFARIDLDRNGEVDLLEFARSQQNRNVRIIDRGSSSHFIESDLDQDGFISLEEYLQRDGAKESLFHKIDLNGSGKVGPFEWVTALKRKEDRADADTRFAKLDSDDNGSVSLEEWVATPLPGQNAETFSVVDLNGNRELGFHEFSKAMASPPDEIGIPQETLREFEDFDTNRDRVISLREFSRRSVPGRRGAGEGMIAHIFDRIDRNGDREIDLQEFQNGPRGGPGRPEGKGRGKGKGPKGRER